MKDTELLARYKLTGDKNIIYYLFQKYRQQLIFQTHNILKFFECDLNAETDFDHLYYEHVASACKMWRMDSDAKIFCYRLFSINKTNIFWYVQKYVRNNKITLDSLQTTSKIEIYDSTLGVTENLQEEVSNNEKEKKLMDYLKQFPKEFRRVILLKYRGANDKEICGKLNISQDKLKNKLKYFKHRFKNEVAGKKITN